MKSFGGCNYSYRLRQPLVGGNLVIQRYVNAILQEKGKPAYRFANSVCRLVAVVRVRKIKVDVAIYCHTSLWDDDRTGRDVKQRAT